MSMSILYKRTKRLALVGIAVVCGFLALSSVANATQVTFNVVNSNGVTQSGVKVLHYSDTTSDQSSKYYYTDYNGQLVVDGRIIQGDKFMFSRDMNATSETTPENSLSTAIGNDHGLTYVFSNQDLPEKEIILPALNNNQINLNPQLTPKIRLLVGLINQERSRQGLNQLPISLSLTNAAQNFADLIESRRVNLGQQTHYYNSTPPARAIDLGFPAFRDPNLGLSYVSGVVENIFLGKVTPHQAFSGWLESPGHKRAMLFEAADVIGIGYTKNVVVPMFANINQTSDTAVAKARLTNDYGDPNIRLEPKPDPDWRPDNAKKGVRLQLGIKSLKHHRYEIAVRNLSKARGKLYLVLKSKRGHKRILVVRSTKHRSLVLRRAMIGRWTVKVRFISSDHQFRNRTIIRSRRF